MLAKLLNLTYLSGNDIGGALVLDSSSSMSFSFCFLRWTCHVPKQNVVTGIICIIVIHKYTVCIYIFKIIFNKSYLNKRFLWSFSGSLLVCWLHAVKTRVRSHCGGIVIITVVLLPFPCVIVSVLDSLCIKWSDLLE